MSGEQVDGDKKESLSKITEQLDKYVKEETNFKSAVETLRKFYKLSKKKDKTDNCTHCFLCK